MESFISGAIVTLLTQTIKKVPYIPINEGNKLALRGVAVILSAVSTIVMAWLAGGLELQNTLPIVAQTIYTYINSVVVYYGLVR